MHLSITDMPLVVTSLVIALQFGGCTTAPRSDVSLGASAQQDPDENGGAQIIINADNLEDARSLAEFFMEREKQLDALVPIGCVIPYVGEPAQLSRNWQVCDGKPLRLDADTRLREMLATLQGIDLERVIVPSFEGRMAVGLSPQLKVGENELRAGGDYGEAKHQHELPSIPLTADATTTPATWTEKRDDGKCKEHTNGTFIMKACEDTMSYEIAQHTHSFSSTGQTAKSTADKPIKSEEASSYPPCVGVVYVMRIR